MAIDEILTAWQDTPDATRRAIVAALQVIADAECAALPRDLRETLKKEPLVDVYASRHHGRDLVVCFLYDFRIARWTRSGSDWDEHYFQLGEALCRDGVVVSHTLVKEMRSIPESQCDAYDGAEAFQQRRKAARREFWDAWFSLPFPFPGTPPE